MHLDASADHLDASADHLDANADHLDANADHLDANADHLDANADHLYVTGMLGFYYYLDNSEETARTTAFEADKSGLLVRLVCRRAIEPRAGQSPAPRAPDPRCLLLVH